MEKKHLILKYIEKSKITVENLPVDLYFIQERINRKKDINKESISNLKLDEVVFTPNILKRYKYNGLYHNIPHCPISQVFNHEKFLDFENISK
jgi:hypothetical protein